MTAPQGRSRRERFHPRGTFYDVVLAVAWHFYVVVPVVPVVLVLVVLLVLVVPVVPVVPVAPVVPSTA